MLGEVLQTIDSKLIDLCQTAYDYVWDRWGVYAGTLRAAIPSLLAADALLYRYIVVSDGRFTNDWLVHAGIWGIYLYVVPVRSYLGKDWYDQNEGRFSEFNRRAELQMTGLSTVIRALLLFLFGFGLVVALFDPTIENVHSAAGVLLISVWLYLLTIKLRDRDVDRFKTRRFSPGAG